MVHALLSSGAAASCALHFPIWRVPYPALLADLAASGWRVEVSAVPEPSAAAPGLAVGAAFGAETAAEAERAGWDAFGENGEFHTAVRPPRVGGAGAAGEAR